MPTRVAAAFWVLHSPETSNRTALAVWGGIRSRLPEIGTVWAGGCCDRAVAGILGGCACGMASDNALALLALMDTKEGRERVRARGTWSGAVLW